MSDFMSLTYSQMRRSMKWYKKLALCIHDVALNNAYILYSSNQAKASHVNFLIQVVEQLLDEGVKESEISRPLPQHVGRKMVGDTPSRLEYKSSHLWPVKIPPTERKQNPSRICIVCKPDSNHAGPRPETRYQCKNCGVALHISPCFETYHTKVNYRKPCGKTED